MSVQTSGQMATTGMAAGGVARLQNAGAPSAGTSAVQTVTLSNFAACTLRLGFRGFYVDVVLAGTENNTAIDTAVTAALESLATVGAGNVTVGVTGTTDRAIAITFAAVLAKQAVPAVSATVSGGAAVAATLSTNLTGSNNDLKFDAVTPGTAGNSITIAYVDPAGNDAELSVVVVSNAITVNLATGVAGAITSTAEEIADAIAASVPAAALVTAVNKAGNDGTGVVTAMAATPLAGGAPAPTVAVVNTTPGVNATGLGASIGSTLTDTTNGDIYVTSTSPVPTWGLVGEQS